MPNGASSIRTPLCPRCGYDQTGLIATWTQSCPLAATCTECGYDYQPADALDPLRKRVRWLYEHRRVWSLPAAIATLVMLAWPPAFWKRVQPEHRVRVGMMAWWVSLLLVGTFVVASLSLWVSVTVQNHYGGHLRWRYVSQRNPGIPPPPPSILFSRDGFATSAGMLLGRRENQAAGYTHPRFPTSVFAAPAFTAAALAVLIALPSYWKQERAAPKHFARIGVYSLTPVIAIYALFCFSLVFTWGEAAIRSYTLWQRPGSAPWWGTSSRVLTNIASGEHYLELLALATAWQLLFFASALRTGLRLRAWRGLWILAGACGLAGVVIVSASRIVWEVGAW